MFISKNRFSIKFVSLLVLLSMSFSLYPVAPENNGVASSGVDDQINTQLKQRLDLLRVNQILDSNQLFDQSNLMISDNEWDELELDIVLENWQKYKKTKFDMWGIKQLLKHAPVGSKEIIRNLIESDEDFDCLDQIIGKVECAQDAIIAYWDENDILHNNANNLYYSMLKKFMPKVVDTLNDSPTVLGVSQAFSYISPAVTFLAVLGVNSIVGSYFSSKIFGTRFNCKDSFIKGLKNPIRDHDPRLAIYKDGYYSFGFFDFYKFKEMTLGDKYVFGDNKVNELFGNSLGDSFIKSKLAALVAVSVVGGLQLWSDYSYFTSIKNSVGKIVFLHKTSKELQYSLVEIANCLKSLSALDDLGLQGDNFALENIRRYLDRENVSQKLNNLLELINSSTFEKEASFWYSKGRLLKTHRLFGQIKDELIPILQNIALLGGYRAIAQMVREHKDSQRHFCFVQNVDSSKPFVQMENAWVPLISEEKVVTNSISLGQEDGPLNMVVTGPNGGGKSTFMMTVAFNVLLSKLGIAAADKACISDFKKIRTSLHPNQDIKSGLSAFMAEHKRVAQVRESINSCDGNILVLLDEPYKGTVEVESASRVYKFGKEITDNNQNCMLLLATHLRKPIELEADTNGLFTNVQMGHIETKAGGFKRTFKVESGPAIWWFDDADRRARFIDWLCETEVEV